jgi:hypothetical protein
MTKTIVADIKDELLSFTSGYSDRFVYSNYFTPLLVTFGDNRTPVLPFYVIQQLLEVANYNIVNHDQLRHILDEIGYGELWSRNAMDQAQERWRKSVPPLSGPGAFPIAKIEKRPTVLSRQDAELIAGLLQSEVGLVFLDRTRIRPVGFALGEHIYALGLAPDEEVTLEQKTFTKRQLTLEEQNEQEKQFDIEFSNTLSTELQEGFERQRSQSDSWGLSASHTGQYSSPANLPWGQINASHTIGITNDVTNASQQTARRSVKDGQTVSSKVSAKYRAQHKTTFRLVIESGFEATSKRTIRNPNRTTPVTLHYFKVLQRLQILQERYGVRLCWAPSIKDPAMTFVDKIRKGRQAIIDEAMRKLPMPPVEPKPSTNAGAPTTTNRETKFIVSPVMVADKWGLSGDMSYDYDVDIPFDPGWSWDGQVALIKNSINVITKRDQEHVTRELVGSPYPTVDGGGNRALRVRIHIGARPWFGGPGISFQVSAMFFKDVTIAGQIAEDTKYNADLTAFRTALSQWTENRDAARTAAQAAGDAFEKQLVDGLSPVNEMISQLIEQHFPTRVRDECWEIDYWQRIFDWERASFVAYPSWWSAAETRNPVLDPSDFINASWAKLYLPVRVGMERLALRWIFGKAVVVPLASEVENRFDVIVNDLRTFRQKVLGAPEEVVELTEACQEAKESFYCLAKWSELMPTDGTHVEIVQGLTSAADPITAQEVKDAAELRAALLESEKRSAKLKDKAYDQMTQPATVGVEIGLGGTASRD